MTKRSILAGLLLAVALFTGAGCAHSGKGGIFANGKNYGGTASVASTNGVNAGQLLQGDNPNSTTKQSLNQDRKVTIKAPASAQVEVDGIKVTGKVTQASAPLVISTNQVAATNQAVAPVIVVASKHTSEKPEQPIEITIENATHNDTQLGSSFMASVKGAATAAMHAMQPVIWAGIAFVFLGAFMLTSWGAVLRIGNGRLSSMVCFLIGAALIVTPALIVGHGVLIICLAIAAFAIYYFVHHGIDATSIRTLVQNAETVVKSTLGWADSTPDASTATKVVAATPAAAPGVRGAGDGKVL